MATGMQHLNVTIFDGAKRLTHWQGSPSEEGGELTMINMTPPGGPPQFDFDNTGKDRTPKTFTVETKILGSTLVSQMAFIADYKVGTLFLSDNITGLEAGINYVVQSANVGHNDKEEPSKLTIKLHEVGSLSGSTTPVGAGSGGTTTGGGTGGTT